MDLGELRRVPDGLENGLAVNAGFMVGHSALRRYVLGTDFKRESTPEEVEQLVTLLDQSLGRRGVRAFHQPVEHRGRR